MAVVIHTETALSTAANTKTADLVTGTYEFIGKGKVTLAAKGSATGMYITLIVGGVTIVSDQPIPYTGTAGTISISDNIVASQMVNGGRVEMYLRNTTGGALTTDVWLGFDPA
jgi:hypothetical protein